MNGMRSCAARGYRIVIFPGDTAPAVAHKQRHYYESHRGSVHLAGQFSVGVNNRIDW